MIPFNKPTFCDIEFEYIRDAINREKLSGGGYYTHACERAIEKKFHIKRALLTPSCTAALEMAALLLEIKPGDEVIVPSYAFVTSASAFALRGAKIIFADIDKSSMNLDIDSVKRAITDKTKVIVVVHYAGISCDMDRLMQLAEKKGLKVVEDAAQAMMSQYNGEFLGSIGHLGAYSFHETKNYTSGGEGGVLLINEERWVERAEIIREKGTDRNRFLRGEVNKYTWRELGSSYLMSEIQAAYLYAQLTRIEEINEKRLSLWRCYFQNLNDSTHLIEIPKIPKNLKHNAHIFFIKLKDKEARDKLATYLSSHGVAAIFHYIPLHTSPAGKRYGEMTTADKNTTVESERILRLPIFYNMDKEAVLKVCHMIKSYFNREEAKV